MRDLVIVVLIGLKYQPAAKLTTGRRGPILLLGKRLVLDATRDLDKVDRIGLKYQPAGKIARGLKGPNPLTVHL